METIKLSEMKWHTATGKVIPVLELDHQHLSNIIWYYKLIVGCLPHPVIQDIIDSHYLGVILAFKPLPIENELRKLRDKGYLMPFGNIVVNNCIIGNVHHIENWEQLLS